MFDSWTVLVQSKESTNGSAFPYLQNNFKEFERLLYPKTSYTEWSEKKHVVQVLDVFMKQSGIKCSLQGPRLLLMNLQFSERKILLEAI